MSASHHLTRVVVQTLLHVMSIVENIVPEHERKRKPEHSAHCL